MSYTTVLYSTVVIYHSKMHSFPRRSNILNSVMPKGTCICNTLILSLAFNCQGIVNLFSFIPAVSLLSFSTIR